MPDLSASAISTQVLGKSSMSQRAEPKEYPGVPLSEREAVEWVGWLSQLSREVDRPTVFLIQQADPDRPKFPNRATGTRQIVAAAASRVGAEILYSEDLNHGQIYGVRSENPFQSVSNRQ